MLYPNIHEIHENIVSLLSWNVSFCSCFGFSYKIDICVWFYRKCGLFHLNTWVESEKLRSSARWVHFEDYTSKFSSPVLLREVREECQNTATFNSSLDESIIECWLDWSSSLGQSRTQFWVRCYGGQTDNRIATHGHSRHSVRFNRNILLQSMRHS